MKKIFLILGLLVGVVSSVRAADPDADFREAVRAYMNSNGVFTAGVTNVLKGAVLPACNGGSVTNLTATNLAGNVSLAQLTNALACVVSPELTNTVASVHTPLFAGQVLMGLSGVGTNAVWLAKGVTTNDWVKLAP
jgi:hypothetical protein